MLVHTPGDPIVLASVTRAAATILEHGRLQAELQVQLAQVRDSRSRLVTAGDAERRRIERDLHDGAQQRIVGLALHLQTAKRRPGLPPQTAELLSFTVEQLHAGLVRILTDDGYQVAAAAGSGPELVAAARAHTPDLVIADVRMPPTHTDDGIVAVREIRRERPGTAIVLLSQYVEATRAMDLFQDNPAGLGYLLKDRVLQIDDFLDAVRRVAAGGTAMDPAVVAQLVGRAAGTADPLAVLTERERAVLALMAEGLSNTGIAGRLFVGVRTVETYINHQRGVHQTRTPHRPRRASPGPGRPGLPQHPRMTSRRSADVMRGVWRIEHRQRPVPSQAKGQTPERCHLHRHSQA